MKPLAECRLYAFVDTAWLRGRSAAAVTGALCEGGADLIQLRAKASAPAEVRRLAETLLPITRSAGVGLVINDFAEIAAQVGADYCHLGQEDFFNSQTRGSAPYSPPVPFGLSTHSPEQASRALPANPAYVAIGPVYATPTKPTALPVTLDYVRWAASHLSLPWFAIGGINLQNLDQVLAAGAQRICVVSAILNSDDIAAACRSFKSRLT